MVFFFHKSLVVGPLNHCLRMFELNGTRPKPSSAAKWHCGGPINEPKSIDTGHKILKCWYMKYICLVVRSLLLYLFKKWQFSPSGTFRRIPNINWWTSMKNGGKLRKKTRHFWMLPFHQKLGNPVSPCRSNLATVQLAKWHRKEQAFGKIN